MQAALEAHREDLAAAGFVPLTEQELRHLVDFETGPYDAYSATLAARRAQGERGPEAQYWQAAARAIEEGVAQAARGVGGSNGRLSCGRSFGNSVMSAAETNRAERARAQAEVLREGIRWLPSEVALSRVPRPPLPLKTRTTHNPAYAINSAPINASNDTHALEYHHSRTTHHAPGGALPQSRHTPRSLRPRRRATALPAVPAAGGRRLRHLRPRHARHLRGVATTLVGRVIELRGHVLTHLLWPRFDWCDHRPKPSSALFLSGKHWTDVAAM